MHIGNEYNFRRTELTNILYIVYQFKCKLFLLNNIILWNFTHQTKTHYYVLLIKQSSWYKTRLYKLCEGYPILQIYINIPEVIIVQCTMLIIFWEIDYYYMAIYICRYKVLWPGVQCSTYVALNRNLSMGIDRYIRNKK